MLVHGYQASSGDFSLAVTDTGTYCGPFYFNCSPANNTCATATEIRGFNIGDNTSSTTTGAASCATSARDVWYRYTPNCHGFLTISTCGAEGSLADTVLSVYDECGGTEIACNDDYDVSTCGRRSQVTLAVEPGEPLLIRVADYGSDQEQGTFPLSVSVAGSITPPILSPPGLYVTDLAGTLDGDLSRIDTSRGTATLVGPLGTAGIVGLAYAPSLGLMYGIDDSPDHDDMVTLNLATGVATAFGPVGFEAVRALAFDSGRLTLYGADMATGMLLSIHPFTGRGVAIGSLGFSSVQGLAYDPDSDTLYGSDTATDQLIRIDIATGAGTAIGPFGIDFHNVQGLAFDQQTRTLWGVQNDGSGTGRLLTIDTTSGAATQVGPVYAEIDGLAAEIVPGLPDATVGEAYSAQIPVSAGCPLYWFGPGSGLPQGLAVSPHGVVLGTPSENGEFIIGVDVDDSNLGTPTVSGAFPLRVRPSNDDCPRALAVETGTTLFDTSGATTDGPDEPGACNVSQDSQVGSDVWFCHTSSCNGDLTVELCGSSYDTKLAVYEGCSCPVASPPLACSDDFCGTTGLQSAVTFAANRRQSYLIRAGGFRSATGAADLSITCTECADDADCEDGNLCTTNRCVGGLCTVAYPGCDDGDPCTIDDCNPATGCAHDPVRCDDNDACTTEVCNRASGVCDITPIVCDDDDPCTTDSCDSATGCTHASGGVADPDCNANGVSDACDIFSQTSHDCNGNAIPDECDGRGDGNGDGVLTPADYASLHACVTAPCATAWCLPTLYADPCCTLMDFDSDGDVDLVDYSAFVTFMSSTPP